MEINNGNQSIDGVADSSAARSENDLEGLAFSIRYTIPGDLDDYAVDFGYQIEGRWTRSCREYGSGHGWQKCGEIDEQAYNFLLESFGLEDKKDEFPVWRIAVMSPYELATLGGKNPASDTMGHRNVGALHAGYKENPGSIYLYLDEKEDNEDEIGYQRALDITLKCSANKGADGVELTRDEMIEIAKEGDVMKKLYAKLGRTDLEPKPGLPKGPYYHVDEMIYEIIAAHKEA
ncbi:hypothetical protein ACFL6I_25440 [candidate division KSB1 bacterium]